MAGNVAPKLQTAPSREDLDSYLSSNQPSFNTVDVHAEPGGISSGRVFDVILTRIMMTHAGSVLQEFHLVYRQQFIRR